MNTLVIVRHGHYDLDSGNLDTLGIKQAKGFGELLGVQVGKSITILSSPVIRANQTAEVIARAISKPPATVRLISALSKGAETNNVDEEDCINVDKTVFRSGKDSDTVLVVTHAPMVARFFQWYMFEKFYRDVDGYFPSHASGFLISGDGSWSGINARKSNELCDGTIRI